MARYLVIVESPAKVKTIKKFLGSNYVVTASNGHVRDLPKSSLGIDVEHDFEPKYITIRGKGDILANLRKEVKKADKIYLATDPDREGEAIAWHLYCALKLEDKKVYRISFNEITKNAVKASIKEAREIDMNLVDAQQARRALDRMVGYCISPLLWKKVKRGLSRLSGYDFEYFCSNMLKSIGFKDVHVTQSSNDSGVDITAVKDSVTYAVQCKCYNSNVGRDAVQEVYSGMNEYQKMVSLVITNSHFTDQAKETARKNKVILWDRKELKRILLELDIDAFNSLYDFYLTKNNL